MQLGSLPILILTNLMLTIDKCQVQDGTWSLDWTTVAISDDMGYFQELDMVLDAFIATPNL